MKRIWSAILIHVLLMVSLVACTSDPEPADSSPTDAMATAASAQAAMEAANARAALADNRVDVLNDQVDRLQRDVADLEAELEVINAGRLERIRSNGNLVCVVTQDVPGFAHIDADGNTQGFDYELCRAVATAVLGDPDAVETRYVTAAERGPIMQSGEIDMMSRITTWTSSRDALWGNFAYTTYYDGQGFMVHGSLGVESAYELDGAAVCVQSGTTTELNLADFFRQNDLTLETIVFDSDTAAIESYLAGQCDVYTTDRSGLAAQRSEFPNPDDHVILAEIISEEPLGPLVPHGDEQWYDIVKIVLAGLIYAEAFGITSDNAAQLSQEGEIPIRRLLGTEGSYGQVDLGLHETVLLDVIRAVGNYGEIYERTLGSGGLNLPRGRNALWLDGGQIFAPPLR